MNFNTFKSHEIKFQDRVRNCEDVLIEEGMGVAFLSCDPGRDQWNTVMVSSGKLVIDRRGLHLMQVPG